MARPNSAQDAERHLHVLPQEDAYTSPQSKSFEAPPDPTILHDHALWMDLGACHKREQLGSILAGFKWGCAHVPDVSRNGASPHVHFALPRSDRAFAGVTQC